MKVCDDIAANIPAEITSKLEEIKQEIVDGKIEIVKAK